MKEIECMNADQPQKMELQICEALDRVAQGETTIEDAMLLAAVCGVRWEFQQHGELLCQKFQK